ncbi:ATP-binding protein [Ramlibacter sp.]|uniref:ATP-binding protein n=1 Tax=Ramlibacter sp. TaxID=1917967 RepID=UPI002D420CBF|nr:ATP-binding protein [Ramlibacter sp.]HYD77551.1 ATP-binding protein [Ramlibacter sp.]
MYLENLKIETVATEKIAPNEKKEADLYARIGYRLEEALADLVDNSIDAEAKNVLIRFQKYGEGIHSVLIVDDGRGMSKSGLKEAMRIGSDTNKGPSQLGKYGTGLKSASLSQAQSVTVLSRQNGIAVGRRWTIQGIRSGWICERLNADHCSRAMNADFGPVETHQAGTMVIWEHLEHLRASRSSLEKVLDRARKTVANELAIRFHRLLEAEAVQIWIDEADVTDEAAGEPVPVLPLNPFSHGGCGMSGYPKELSIELQKHRASLKLELHIWPAKSNLPGYRLGGGKVASRQGFYFYRNDRVIQAGGWNGLQGDDSEPHLSLARVAIDLPPKLESLFKLDIGKSMIDPPVEFSVALESGETGAVFRKFLKDAEATYRHQKRQDSAKFAFTGGNGFPAAVRKKMRAALSEKGLPAPSEGAVRWTRLPADELFRIEPASAEIQLNKNFQATIERDSAGAAVLVKALFLLLFQDDLAKSFMTEASRDRIRRINQALLATLP